MSYHKKLFQLFVLFYSILFYSQLNTKDSLRGEFIYLLKAKLNTLNPNQTDEELFSLQVADYRTFFSSLNSLKRDSVAGIVSRKAINNGGGVFDFRGTSMPQTKFSYTIIQTNENIQYFQRVAMSLLSYKESVIKDWKLIDETKIINTINCKKAKVSYKGRNWTAWYSAEIPLPYGPYKFSGLPGLIIKITDDKGDYDFELVRSVSNSKLKDRLVNIYENRYTNSTETTKTELEKTLQNFRENSLGTLESLGTSVTPEQRKIIMEKQKEMQLRKKGDNPIELN
ncbi:GLPGLI family protein [Chryseobacterium sp. SL1]|uniref:GLPGLI family protein n=1 Tax=Chryseobacterium sp. SL1 TaxID=2995159 RepID=UPI002275CCA9|nr:GLPGLI family protein [Chryseobacterium sp. SL1]MCY1663175.1 GLPGLI family protein [Chryseobacterium sp. SL1]